MIQEGEYDQAIDDLVEKLQKNNKKTKNIALLEEAYLKANQKDDDSIMKLKESGMPYIWEKVYKLYRQKDKRQYKIRELPVNVVQGLDVEWIDYERDIETAKSKAAAYYYAHAKKLLGRSGRENALKAYQEFWKVTTFYKDYKDANKLMLYTLLRDCGTLPVKVVNRTGNELPDFFPASIVAFNLNVVEKAYLDYTLKPIKDYNYPYTISIIVDRILLTPDKSERADETVNNSVQIPLEDSLQFEVVTCDIYRISQHKACEIISLMSIIDNQNGKAIYQTPVRAKTVFEHTSYYLKGDPRACPPEFAEKIKTGEKPFPSEDNMVKGTALKLSQMIKDIIWDSDYVFE
jgi:hypothetical protein